MAESLETRMLLSSTPAMVADISPGSESSNAQNFLAIGSTTYFTANDGVHGQELWKSDGTPAGTVMVADLYAGDFSASPSGLTNLNGTLYFTANDGVHGTELWTSDGTAAGTVLVADISPFGSYPVGLTNVNGTLYFSADNAVDGRELWKSDGTDAGTTMVKDLFPGTFSYYDYYGFLHTGPNSSSPASLTNVGGTLFFTANDGSGYRLWTSDGSEAGTAPVSSSAGWNASNLTNVNGTLFFTSYGVDGNELWKSDGTESGTTLVKDINPGTTTWYGYYGGSYTYPNSSNPTQLTAVNGTLFFTADDGVHGQELWRSDGTTDGTVMVADISPFGSSPANLTNVNGTLFFSDDNSVDGRELWKSDGTPDGTSLVKDIRLGGAGSDLRSLTGVGGTVYFSADDGAHGTELWKSDGTTDGTVMIKDLVPRGRVGVNVGYPYGSNPGNLTNVNGTLFFTADDRVHGTELWALNGVGAPGFDVSVSLMTTAAGSAVSVTVTAKNADGSTNTGYVGTVHFTSTDPQADLPDDYTFTAADHGTHTFTATLKTAGYQSIAATDTQAQGTAGAESSIFVVPGAAATIDISGFPSTITAGVRSKIIVSLKDAYGNNASNYTGTIHFSSSDAGAMLPADYIFTAADAGQHTFSAILTTAGTRSITVADTLTGVSATQNGIAVTAGGALPFMVADILAGPQESTPLELVAIGSTTYFIAYESDHGQELWKSDGTAAGTVLVKDIMPGGGSSNIYYLTNVNGTLYFTADDGAHGPELWKSDGTAAGTTMVKDIFPGSGYSYYGYIHNLTAVGGTLFFAADDGVNGVELWKSDGTAAGTMMIKDIYPGGYFYSYDGYDYSYPNHSYPENLTNVNGVLYFTADDGDHGVELWRSDGTAAGTHMVKDIFPGHYHGYALSSYPINLTSLNGTLYFAADDGIHGIELWRSDGTSAGTQIVKDVNPNNDQGYHGYPGYYGYDLNLTSVNGTLYFTADDGVHGLELWKSNGTEAGTQMVKDINPGVYDGYAYGSYLSCLIDVNGVLYFTADDGVHGVELWKSDGTAAGTVLVADIQADGASSFPSDLTNVNGTLYFTAEDAVHGRELWKSDGTADGTRMVMDIFPDGAYGYGGSYSPYYLTNANGTLFFTANDGAHGTELWALRPTGASSQSLTVDGFPTTSTAGSAGTFTVTVKNSDGTTNTSYTGTVHFTSSDPQAFLPIDYTFTAADQGTHTFFATLKTAGHQSITATDTQAPGLSGVDAVIQIKAAAASTMFVGGFPSPNTAGVAQDLVVTLKDPYGNVATGYTGQVHFTSSDPQAVLPANYTFTAADQGTHTFSTNLKTAGTQWIAATDIQAPSVSGVEAIVQVKPAAASTLTVSGFPSSIAAEVAGNVIVTLKDSYGNIATGYAGTVHFASSDPQAVLPLDYTFTAADQGTHTFSATLKTGGSHSIIATDIQTSGLNGTESNILVTPAPGGTGYPNLGGSWTRDGQQLTNIQQSGLALIFTDEAGHVSTGTFSDIQTISGLDGMTGTIDTALSDDGRIVWTNGQTTFTWQRVSLGGQFFNPSNSGLTSVSQVGTALIFTNRAGGTSLGTLLSPTTATIPGWNQTATFVDGSLQFANGSSWTKLDLSEEYRNTSQQPVRVLQNGTTQLTFVNRVGQTSDGFWISPTQVRATTWNVIGTIANGQIQWSNNSVWNKNLTVMGSSSGQGQVSILATNQIILLTNKTGGVSRARITGPDTIVAVDWGGVAGTIAGGKILWSNNTVWDTFNSNALDAVFGDVTTFPFL